MGFAFGIAEVAFLLETSGLRLNKLMDRFKVRHTLEGGTKRGKRFRFSVEDVCKLGIALWLFQSGLRMAEIERVLSHKNTKALLAKLTSIERVRREAKEEKSLITWKRVVGNKSTRHVTVVKHGSKELRKAMDSEGLVSIPLGSLLCGLLARFEK